MAEKYFVECDCGKRIRVELFNAGTTKVCPSCNSEVSVPDSITLKELSGDKYPFLRPIEKIQQALRNAEPPFDGLCHVCSDVDADHQVPITFNVMVERHVEDDGGIRPTITGKVELYAAASEELRQSTTFPLLLCTQCHAQFQSASSRAKVKNIVNALSLAALFGAFLYFAYHHAEVVATLAGIISLIGAIAWAAKFRQTKKLDPFVLSWLSNIRWVPEAIEAEDEYTLSIGESRPFQRSAT